MKQPLDDKSRKALYVILEKGMIRGGELMAQAGLASLDDLKSAVQPLLEKNIVMASGPVVDKKDFISARFYILPSDVKFASKIAQEY